MKVAVMGLTHLGAVTALCLENFGHEVIACEPDMENVRRFAYCPDEIEPGLSEMKKGVDQVRFRIANAANEIEGAIRCADVVWFCYEPRIDSNGNPHHEEVILAIEKHNLDFQSEQLVIISSQLPVGSMWRIENACSFADVTFACVPENLRHGDAVKRFTYPDRMVVGMKPGSIRAERVEAQIKALLPECMKFLFVTWETAEMIKHAINCFLATEISFANEIGRIATAVGADPDDVSKGLMSDVRIGPMAYLKPGAPYTDQTLGRDMRYLLQKAIPVSMSVLAGVHDRNLVEKEKSRGQR